MVAARKNHDQAILYGKLRDFGVTREDDLEYSLNVLSKQSLKVRKRLSQYSTLTSSRPSTIAMGMMQEMSYWSKPQKCSRFIKVTTSVLPDLVERSSEWCFAAWRLPRC